MKELTLYIHSKDGCAGESEHYKPLFPECEAIGDAIKHWRLFSLSPEQEGGIRPGRVIITEYGVIWRRGFFLPLLMMGY